MHRLRGGRRRPQEVGVGPALGEVVGAGEAERRRLVLADIVGDRQKLEGGERTEDDVDLIALDQFLRLGLGAGRLAAGIGGEELDLAAGHLVVVLLQPGEHALLHLDAALRQAAGLDREQAELERRALRDRRRGEPEGRGRRAGGGGGHEFTASHLARHCIVLPLAPSGASHDCAGLAGHFVIGRCGLIRSKEKTRSSRPLDEPIAPSSAIVFRAVKPGCSAGRTA